MIICNKCFADETLSAIVASISSEVGVCPTCKSVDAHLCETSANEIEDLSLAFEELLGVYEKAEGERIDNKSLYNDLKERWNLFSIDDLSVIKDVVIALAPNEFKRRPDIFSDSVFIPVLHDTDFLRRNALVKTNNWDDFVMEVKQRNRYHSRLLNLDKLEKFCSFIRKNYSAGQLFYRARISSDKGFPPTEMSAPPFELSSEGRANARGITCLYVSLDKETTLHEIRAVDHDYVCIGTFRLKNDITIVNLADIAGISPFIEELSFEDYIINKAFLEKMNNEMSKVMRKSDSTLDYVPTQYISDFIKSIRHDGKAEYDGIEYKSATNNGGVNLAIFNPDDLECISTTVYDIDSVGYHMHMV